MRKHLIWVLGLAIAVAAAGIAVGANNQSVQFTMTPAKQPKLQYKKAAINVITETGSTDGSTIAPATRAQLKFDDDFKFTTRGLATCRSSQIENTTTAQARAACRSAQVGAGTAEAKIGGAPNSQPVQVIVTAFNGVPQGGKPVLLLHSRADATSLTTVLTGVLKNSSGDFGKELDVTVPPLPFNTALTRFQTRVTKTFRFRGRSFQYVSARCFDGNKTWNLQAKFTYDGNPPLTANDTQRCQVK